MSDSTLHKATGKDLSRDLFLDDVVAGLTAQRKSLDPKYFYDETGSGLFGRITELPEYYITRTETEIMRAAAPDISAHCGDIRTIVEFGSGSGERSEILLSALDQASHYAPIDVSDELLQDTATVVQNAHPSIQVVPIVADFTSEILLPARLPRAWLGYFPGSTIGNFLPMAATRFLANARRMLGRHATMLIGVDLVKSVDRLEQAYDDSQGVTDAFNKNVLVRINNELGGTFDVQQFEHRAVFNKEQSRIEMHLVSKSDQFVEIDGTYRIRFRAGETIHTENSHKYTLDGFRALARQAGWSPVACWTDVNDDFSVHLLRGVAGPQHDLSDRERQ
ncbi:MAG: L-histidine N(alpha)-methyltransferase [Gammaproteobacteria bacterium]|nr:L-histidine N(alpha)-methyltransferase [Gammaproteobacteria bacterium]